MYQDRAVVDLVQRGWGVRRRRVPQAGSAAEGWLVEVWPVPGIAGAVVQADPGLGIF
jgi:hypothetical protein